MSKCAKGQTKCMHIYFRRKKSCIYLGWYVWDATFTSISLLSARSKRAENSFANKKEGSGLTKCEIKRFD